MKRNKKSHNAKKRQKSKAELMRNTRANRKKAGLVELRLWLTPQQKERVLKYVVRLKRDA